MSEIAISRMFAGRYQEETLGHEVINLRKSDNGNNYIYINPHGTLGQKHDPYEVKAVILVEWEDKTTMRVLAKAEKLTPLYSPKEPRESEEDHTKRIATRQIEKIKADKIFYDGVPLNDIHDESKFTRNSGIKMTDQVYFSFQAEKLVFAKDNIFLKLSELGVKNFPTEGLHWSYSVFDNSKQYEILEYFLKNPNNWQPETVEFEEGQKIIASKNFKSMEWEFKRRIDSLKAQN